MLINQRGDQLGAVGAENHLGGPRSVRIVESRQLAAVCQLDQCDRPFICFKGEVAESGENTDGPKTFQNRMLDVHVAVSISSEPCSLKLVLSHRPSGLNKTTLRWGGFRKVVDRAAGPGIRTLIVPYVCEAVTTHMPSGLTAMPRVSRWGRTRREGFA